MNRQVVSILVAAITILLLPVMALAIDVPHDTIPVGARGGHGFTCFSCHSYQSGAMGTSPDYLFNNICLTCHKVGGSAARQPFIKADAANPLNTYTGPRPGTVYQTSHNWVGKDMVPAAGALPPTDSKLLYPLSLNGSLSCARCHGIHGSMISSFTSPPFLRGLAGQDQICLDCHRPRRTTTHISGSHPVEINYAATVAAHPNDYYATPVSANPANYTAQLQLKNGAVLCTTCHGVHYSDSNSRTFDNRSSARLGLLSTSKGMLLWTDMRGSANDTKKNICTNCHQTTDSNPLAKVRNHNGSTKQQNVQCTDCHGGHVDLANGTTPNVFLVNRYMNISTQYRAVRNKQVLYQYTSLSRRNYNKDAYGVCLACHSPLPNTVAQHVSTDATICDTCHKHSKGFSADCTSCHGYPPTQNVAMGPNGYGVDGAKNYLTSGVFKNESQTPHGVHAAGTPYSFKCEECHNGYGTTHDTGTFQDVFIQASNTLISNGKGTLVPSYTATGAGTCSTYCHSNGNPANAPYVVKAVSWGSMKGTIIGQPGECSACHDTAATFTTTAHVKHVSATNGKGYACVTCHALTVNGAGAVIDNTKHVNAVKEVLFSGSIGVNTLSGSTCATVYCHSDGRSGAPVITPVWSTPASGQCGACHANPMTNYGHTAHFGTLGKLYGPNMGTTVPGACTPCHTYTTETAATHVNGTVDMAANGCVTCHPVSGTYQWIPTNRITCVSCHSGWPGPISTLSVINGKTAPYKSFVIYSTVGHGQSGANYAASHNCETCHNNNSTHIGVVGGTKRLFLANNNTLCASCHNDPAKVFTIARRNLNTHVLTVTEATNGTPTMDCKVCHNVHGTANLHMVLTTIAGLPVTFTNSSSGYVKANGTGLCQVCHSGLRFFNLNQPMSSFTHPTKFCISCHSHKETYAFKPKACDQCHGYPPAPAAFVPAQGNYSSAKAEDYNDGGAAHVKAGHIRPTARPSEGWSNCAVCHSNGSLSPATHLMKNPPYPPNKLLQIDVTVDLDDHYKFNNSYPLGRSQYSGPLNGQWTTGNSTGGCSNVSCHFQRSPKWGSF